MAYNDAGEPAGNRALTVAIIGAGVVGRHHATAFARLAPDVRVIAVADPQIDRANELAAASSARAVADYEMALALQPDIAVVCVPHHLHREVGLAAADAGIHVLMEKPLAHTLADGVALVTAFRDRNLALATSFVHRYRLEFQTARRLIQEGQVGRPALVVDRFCFPGGQTVPGWVWDKDRSGGGILMYSGIHSIDRLRWLLDSEVREVFARTTSYSQTSEVEDGLTAILTFDNDCTATLVETQPAYPVQTRHWDFELYGSAGSMRIRSGKFLEYNGHSHAYHMDVARDDHFLAQARDFVTAVRTHGSPWITGEDGLRALEVATAIYRSAESGQLVRLPA